MAHPIAYEDIDNWGRVGHGRIFDFFATWEEMQGWLLTELPDEYGPYQLVGLDRVKRKGPSYLTVVYRYGISELKKALIQVPRGSVQSHRRFIRIWAKGLTPEAPSHNELKMESFFAFNGMIAIDSGGSGCACVGIQYTPIVMNDETGEKVTHKEYEDIFNRDRKSVV